MSLTDAQRIFAKILRSNLAGPLPPIRQNYNSRYPMAGKALPKGFSEKKVRKQIAKAMPLPPQYDRASVDPAAYILQHSAYGRNSLKNLKPVQTLASKQEDEDPSALQKIFDTLAIPFQLGFSFVQNAAEVASGQETFWDAQKEQYKEIAASGARLLDNAIYKPNLPGQIDDRIYQGIDRLADQSQRLRGTDVLESAGVPEGFNLNKTAFGRGGGHLGSALGALIPTDQSGQFKARELAGLGLDLVADPLNFVGVGALGATGKALQAKKALELAAASRQKNLAAATHFYKPQRLPKLPPVAEDVLGGPRSAIGSFGGIRNIPKPRTQAFRRTLEEIGLPRVGLPRPAVSPSLGAHMHRRADQGIDLDGPGVVELGGAHATRTPDFAAAQRAEQARHAAMTRHYGKNYENLPREMTEADALAIGDNLRDNLLRSQKKVMDKRGYISATSITKVIDDIKEGIVPKEAPKIEPLKTPEAVAAVKAMADDFATGGAMTPKRQVQLYNRVKESIRVSTKLPANKQQEVLISALKSAEDHLINLGKNPIYHTGMQVRLSDIIAESPAVPIDVILKEFAKADIRQVRSPIVKQAIERAIARRSILTGGAIGALSRLVQLNKMELDNAYYSHPRKKIETDRLLAEVTKATEKSNLTDQERQALFDHLRAAIDVDSLPADVTLSKVGELLSEAVASGRVNPKVVMKVQKDVAKTIGEPNMYEHITGHKYLDQIMLTFTTWWGKKDLIRSAKDYWSWAEQNAVANAKLMRDVQEHYTIAERQQAWAFAAGRRAKEGAESPRVAALGMMYLREFEHLVGSSGLEKELMHGTVALRSQMAMDDINKQLKRVGEDFRFHNRKGVITVDGRKVDYSGVDERGIPNWLKSWENYSPKDPSSFLYNLGLAMERVTKEYAWLDNLAYNFGSLSKGGRNQFGDLATFNIPHPRLKEVYFPPEIGKQMLRILKDFEDPLWKGSKPVQQYAKALRFWKISVTIYNPSHHVRNGIGDAFLMWLAGINDVRVFSKAQRVIYPNRRRYEGAIKTLDFNSDNVAEQFSAALADMKTLVGDGSNVALEERMLREWSSARPNDVISNVKGTRVTGNSYYVAAHRYGLLPDANQAEDIFGQSAMGRIAEFKPIGATHEKVSNFSEYRDHYFRIAHFIGATEKNLKKGMRLDEAFEFAAHEVRKWHPDGRDLTKFEQKIRLMIPFYSWTRKSTPLIIQGLFQSPAKVLAWPKIHTSLQEMAGIETDGIHDPFPDDALFPDWMRGTGHGPLGEVGAGGFAGMLGSLSREGSDPLTGKPDGYVLANPGNPFNDFIAQFLGTGRPTDPGMGALESITPFARIPLELAQGREISGKPIADDVSGYLGENIPFLAPASRMFNFGPLGPTERAQRTGDQFDTETFVNWLSALGLRNAGYYRKSAEFDSRERMERFKKRRTFTYGD